MKIIKSEYLKPEFLMRYELFIIVGILMTIGSLIKLIGIYDFSSDWFWFLAGVGLIVEGIISLIKQRRFDKKYKIIEKKINF